MQNQVSDAFDRIEFDHVDEYLLTMKDLAENYRIKVAPECTEVISLDIANVGSKLGIEVSNIDPIVLMKTEALCIVSYLSCILSFVLSHPG